MKDYMMRILYAISTYSIYTNLLTELNSLNTDV